MLTAEQTNSKDEHRKKVSDRITESGQYSAVFKNGKSYACKELVMYVLSNGTGTNRYGITVSKRVGNSVVRHRVSRLIRESIRLNGSRIKPGYDIVVVARANAKGKNYFDISRSFLFLAGLHGVIIRE